MNKPTSLIIVAVVILGLIVLFSATFVVDETEQAIGADRSLLCHFYCG